jgi:hypothetical protein
MRAFVIGSWLMLVLSLALGATACDDDDGGGGGTTDANADAAADGRGGRSDVGAEDTSRDLSTDGAGSDLATGSDASEPDATDDGGGVDAPAEIGEDTTSGGDMGMGGDLATGSDASEPDATDDGGGVDAPAEIGEDTTSGGDMGMGGDLADATGGDGGSGGACDNPGDFAALGDPELDTEAEIGGCALSCALTGPECSVPCVEEGLGVSNGCAVCFGDVISCTVANCAFQCLDSSSTACRTCQETSCFPAFTECAGISLPE